MFYQIHAGLEPVGEDFVKFITNQAMKSAAVLLWVVERLPRGTTCAEIRGDQKKDNAIQNVVANARKNDVLRLPGCRIDSVGAKSNIAAGNSDVAEMAGVKTSNVFWILVLGIQIRGSVIQITPIGRIAVRDRLFAEFGDFSTQTKRMLVHAILHPSSSPESAPMILGLAIRDSENHRQQYQQSENSYHVSNTA